MRIRMDWRGLATAWLTVVMGCSSSETVPAYNPEKAKAVFEEETSAERKILQELEQKHGPNHPQVKQMRMELGLDPQPSG